MSRTAPFLREVLSTKNAAAAKIGATRRNVRTLTWRFVGRV